MKNESIPHSFLPDTRLLRMTVYRPVRDGFMGDIDCTNGGVSGKNEAVYMVCESGNFKLSEVDPSLVFIPEHRGGNYWALSPYVVKPGHCGPMDGGNLAVGDGRANGIVYHIHDRFETWEHYNAISRD